MQASEPKSWMQVRNFTSHPGTTHSMSASSPNLDLETEASGAGRISESSAAGPAIEFELQEANSQNLSSLLGSFSSQAQQLPRHLVQASSISEMPMHLKCRTQIKAFNTAACAIM